MCRTVIDRPPTTPGTVAQVSFGTLVRHGAHQARLVGAGSHSRAGRGAGDRRGGARWAQRPLPWGEGSMPHSPPRREPPPPPRGSARGQPSGGRAQHTWRRSSARARSLGYRCSRARPPCDHWAACMAAGPAQHQPQELRRGDESPVAISCYQTAQLVTQEQRLHSQVRYFKM